VVVTMITMTKRNWSLSSCDHADWRPHSL